MLEFIPLLRQRYQAVLSQHKDNSAIATSYRQRIEQLIFAEAFLRKGQLLENDPKLPLQIAIIGPTQAGKSSLTNVILNSEVAQISPLAGYTVHPQGFCVEVSQSACYSLQHYFGRYQQLTPQQLSKNRYDCYALAENPHPTGLLPPCVFWDTPDFDSIDAADYKEGVIRTIALADIIVLALSKEKYADQSVWELMATLAVFKQPTLVCINKLNEGNEEIIIKSLQEKWRHARSDAFPAVVPLFYEKHTGLPRWDSQYSQVFFQLAKKVDHRQHKQCQQNLINLYWQGWIEPLLAEQQQQQDWQTLVDTAIAEGLRDYQRDYLNHPLHYETFQQAILELLNLLEIPGLAGFLSTMRRVLTWPIKQIARLGRSKEASLYANQELVLLNQIGTHVLTQLAEQLLEKHDSGSEAQRWWQSLRRLLRQQQAELLQDFNQSAAHYQQTFYQEVDATAQRLYLQLEQHPIILNSLRATRISADAALVGLTIHFGGIGLHDLFITPAMMSVTSLLTESAIGGYMKTVEAQLKQQQLLTLKNEVFTAGLRRALLELPDLTADHQRFAISPEQLQHAQQQRIEKRHGLRLF